MLSYSKLAQGGIAAVSYLASTADENRLVGSAEIATERNLSRTLVAKILTILSTSGIVNGKPGPSGGYTLSRLPSEISLLDVVKVFEDPNDRVMCPFGPGWCEKKSTPHCPLHDFFFDAHQKMLGMLDEQDFAQFAAKQP
jgi:Rrf2 family iron-sulfur cluster assembly transcriptional regulator